VSAPKYPDRGDLVRAAIKKVQDRVERTKETLREDFEIEEPIVSEIDLIETDLLELATLLGDRSATERAHARWRRESKERREAS